MVKELVCFIVLAGTVLAGIVHAQNGAPMDVVNQDNYAFATEDKLNQISDLASSGDNAAFSNELAQDLIDGMAIPIHKGDKVYWEGSGGWFSDHTQIRYPGLTSKWWTLTKFLDQLPA